MCEQFSEERPQSLQSKNAAHGREIRAQTDPERNVEGGMLACGGRRGRG
jgi:hypothetical protein